MPEMFVDYATVPLMIHAYQTAQLYPPAPHYVEEVKGVWRIDGEEELPKNEHRLFYHCYLDRRSQVGPMLGICDDILLGICTPRDL